MQGPIRAAALVLAALMLVPTGAATWSGFGASEPDSKNHDSSSFMFYEPPGTAKGPAQGSVYFNHFDTEIAFGNPNVATTQSRMATTGINHPTALLGQWTDCNQDGYIGVAESALEEYPSALLTADQVEFICPDGTPNNAGGWVTELRWIGTNYDILGGGSFNSQADPRMIIDNASMVWGDHGLPDDEKSILGGDCLINPGRGDLHSTGALLNFADCGNGFYQNYNEIFYGSEVGAPGFGVPNQQIPGVDPTNQFGLAGDNCYGQPGCANWRSTPLDRQTAGPDQKDGGHSMLVAQDCNGPSQLTPIHDALVQNDPNFRKLDQPGVPVTPGNFIAAVVYEPAEKATASGAPRAFPSGGIKTDPSGSVAATGTELYEETADDCHVDQNEPGFYSCYQVDGANVCESNSFGSQSSSGKLKINPDSIFNFSTPFFGRGFVGGPVNTGPMNSETPVCLGSTRVFCGETIGGFGQEEAWSDTLVGLGNTPNLVTGSPTRGDLGIAGPQFTTYYAHVSLESGTTPGGHGIYGATQCLLHEPGSPPAHGWACDPTAWYKGSDGKYPQELQWFPHAKVGAGYELRDVDCYDGQIVSGVPVYAGTGGVAATNCDSG